MSLRYKIYCTVLGAAPILAVSPPALAQGGADNPLGEIVVTAQKREQSIQDVGISVTALSGDTTSALGVKSTTDLAAQLPGIQMFDALGGPGQNVSLAIRGIGLNDFQDGTEAPSVIYVDEFYVLPLAGGSVAAYDLERVEALRGPQGTLFGRNATGGLIHFITVKPSFDDVKGYASVTIGEHSQINAEGAVNLPLTDRVATRLAVSSSNNKGWQRNVTGGPSGGETDWQAIRNQWRFEPTDTLDIVAKVEWSRARGDTGYYQHLPAYIDAAGNALAVPDDLDVYGTCAGCDPIGFKESQVGAGTAFDTVVANGSPQRLAKNETLNFTGKMSLGLGEVDLTSVTGYLDLDKRNREDCDSSPADICRTDYAYSQEEFTQELRASEDNGSTRWTVGLFYLHQSARNQQYAALDTDGYFGLTGIPGVPYIYDSRWKSKLNAYAAFAQIEQDLSPTVTLIGGLRYSYDKRHFELLKQDYIADPDNLTLSDGSARNAGFMPLPGLPYFGGLNFTRDGAPFDVDLDFDLVPDVSVGPAGELVTQSYGNVSLRAEIDWRPDDDLLFYASFNRGAKSGGFNNGFIAGVEAGASNADVPFGEEIINAYELGFKATLFDSHARLNGAIFYYDYKDYQAFSFVGLAGVTTNADARIYGSELELYLNPVRGLSINLGASLLDSKVEDISNGVTVADREMGLAPTFSANGLARYEFGLFGGSAAIQADFSHVGKRYTDVQNNPIQLLPSYTIANSRVSWTSSDDRLELSAFVHNIGDVQTPTFIFNLASLGFAQVNMSTRPRWFGGGVRYRF